MEGGYTTAVGLIGLGRAVDAPKLVFVVCGEQTSGNPAKAFAQGLREAPEDEAYLLRGHRCPACGTVELVALDALAWTQ
jgi:hypothetical protein